MAGRYDHNPFAEEEEVNPFAGAGRVPPATKSRLSPLPPEPAGFYNNASIDIPLDSTADLKMKEKELQAKEAELRRREQELKRKEDAAARGSLSSYLNSFPLCAPFIANHRLDLNKFQYFPFLISSRLYYFNFLIPIFLLMSFLSYITCLQDCNVR
nr:secretory carrier-associated membrane protein 2-like [Ipomoea batatas]